MVKAVCDVCEQAEGSVYCFEESSVMCRGCDHRSDSDDVLLIARHTPFAISMHCVTASL